MKLRRPMKPMRPSNLLNLLRSFCPTLIEVGSFSPQRFKPTRLTTWSIERANIRLQTYVKSTYNLHMVSRVAEGTDSSTQKPRRRLPLLWFALPVLLFLALGVALLLRTPPLTKQVNRFLGTWTYSGSEGAKNKFMHFRADGSAHWWSAQGSGSYLEWAVDGDSMEFRQYTTKRSAQLSRLTALIYGPYEGDDFEIVFVSDDEFTLRRDYRDGETGEMKSGTTVYRRIKDEIAESAE